MESAFWDRVVAEGHRVPSERSLADLTAELTAMLGDPDPRRRHSIAFAVLAAWVSEGVYDDLLQGLGDGMTSGLLVDVGQDGGDSVFRRSYSARLLSVCVSRDNKQHILSPDTLLTWGDRVAGWLVRERDLRGYVPGKGWAHAVAHGADALGTLAESPAMGRLELTVLLDVIADRVLSPTDHRFTHGEDDRLARATLSILRRNLVDQDVLETWLARLGASGLPAQETGIDPYRVAGNVQGFLRALYLQVALAPDPPAHRADLMLTLIDQLRRSNPGLLS